MKNFFTKIGVGCIIATIIILISFFTKNEKIFTYGIGIVAGGSIAIGGIASGLGGDRYHRTYAEENANERHNRIDLSGNIILIGIPSILAFLFY